jgi:hypothetical protein
MIDQRKFYLEQNSLSVRISDDGILHVWNMILIIKIVTIVVSK